MQRAENKLTAAQEKLEQEKEKAQERYKRDLTSGMRRLFNIQSYDSKELNGLLETPMLEMQQGVKLLKAEKDDLFEAVMNLGTETMPADDYYREIRDTIYGQKVFVPEWVRTEFGDDWNSFKKRAMGRHKFYFVEDEGKQGIDQLYKELAEQYLGAFPGTYDMTEMLRLMEDMADKGMDTKLPYAALGAIYSGSTAEGFRAAQKEGIPAKVYARFWTEAKELHEDKDEEGDPIRGSRKEKVIELIDSLNLTAEQKDWLVQQEYKSVNLWEMPWR